MEGFNRRLWLKNCLTGLGAIALGADAFALCVGSEQSHTRCTSDELWKRIDDAQARDLVVNAIGAARAQVEYSRSTSAARRAAALLGPGSGREQEARAQVHFGARAAYLRSLKQALARFTGTTDEGRAKRVAEFITSGGLRELVSQARQEGILRLLDSDLSPEEAQNAVKSLDATLSKIEGLKSFQDLAQYFDRHLDELLAKKIGNPSIPQGLCILILVITSLFAVLVVIAVLVCALTLGLACQGVLQQLLDNACPP